MQSPTALLLSTRRPQRRSSGTAQRAGEGQGGAVQGESQTLAEGSWVQPYCSRTAAQCAGELEQRSGLRSSPRGARYLSKGSASQDAWRSPHPSSSLALGTRRFANLWTPQAGLVWSLHFPRASRRDLVGT